MVKVTVTSKHEKDSLIAEQLTIMLNFVLNDDNAYDKALFNLHDWSIVLPGCQLCCSRCGAITHPSITYAFCSLNEWPEGEHPCYDGN